MPPPSFPYELCPARPQLARRLGLSGARTPSTQLTCSRGALPPATSPFPDPPPLPRRTVAAAATYHKEVVGLPLPLPPLCLPSFLRLSVSRSFLRGNWMTQKASQVSAARRCGDATRRAGRQISCSPPNATPQRDRDVQDQTVEQSANWTAKTRANPGGLDRLSGGRPGCRSYPQFMHGDAIRIGKQFAGTHLGGKGRSGRRSSG